jgi:hypothetical protein
MCADGKGTAYSRADKASLRKGFQPLGFASIGNLSLPQRLKPIL